jgi:O-methyltransferase involved in polyketide biosynthesis
LISKDYWLISGDLTDFKNIIDNLVKRGLDTFKPTLFLSECVLIYINPSIGDEIISLASNVFQKSYFITYEQVNPDDAFGKTMISNLASRGVSLESLSKYPSLESQQKRYNDLGFKDVQVMDLFTYWTSQVSDQEKIRISKLEIFDEVEEWKLLTTHYCFVFAHN